MKNPLRRSFITGFALFSMFFGAGNVIFPPQLGYVCGGKWLTGFLAYYLADIGLALLTLAAVLRRSGPEHVLRCAGPRASRLLMHTVVLCIGPLLAIPRTAATTYELSLLPLTETVPQAVFSAAFFFLIALLCLRRTTVVETVGKILTPLLLTGLLALILKGVLTPLGEIPLTSAGNAAAIGIEAGYQTMDVLGALVFGILLLNDLPEHGASRTRGIVGAAAVAGTALFAVYLGLTYLGVTASAFPAASRTELVIYIVDSLLGSFGVLLFSAVVALACITTAAALVSASAAHFAALFPERNVYPHLVFAVCGFSATVSCFGLEQIVAVSSPILSIIYPPILALVLLSFFRGASFSASYPFCGADRAGCRSFYGGHINCA